MIIKKYYISILIAISIVILVSGCINSSTTTYNFAGSSFSVPSNFTYAYDDSMLDVSYINLQINDSSNGLLEISVYKYPDNESYERALETFGSNDASYLIKTSSIDNINTNNTNMKISTETINGSFKAVNVSLAVLEPKTNETLYGLWPNATISGITVYKQLTIQNIEDKIFFEKNGIYYSIQIKKPTSLGNKYDNLTKQAIEMIIKTIN